jgi:hypothetical protein
MLALAVAPCVAVAVLLRTEAVLFAVGLAAAAAVAGLRRGSRLVAAAVAGSAVVAAAGASLGEAAWIRHIVGGSAVGTGTILATPTGGFVGGRVDAFLLTWLRPSYRSTGPTNLLLVVMVAAVVLAAFSARRLPAERRGIRLLAGVAASAALLALVLTPRNIVPGLLVACPLLIAGLAMIDGAALRATPARLAVVSTAGFALLVLATQYRTGGSGEWGGRYFALGLPVVLPVVVSAVRRHGSRALAAGLVVCTLAMSVMAVTSLRAAHRVDTRLVAAIDRAAGPDRPVLVTTVPLVPRMAWATFDHQRWLLSRPTDLAALVGRFDAAGITRFTYVARGDADVALLPPSMTREASTSYHGWQILVLRTS